MSFSTVRSSMPSTSASPRHSSPPVTSNSLNPSSSTSSSSTSSTRSSPHNYNIRGIPVSFPYAAYPNQLLYMDKAIAACEQSQHALLESPTGTGKCFAAGTHLRLADGGLIAVENVVGGEQLMGDDGLPRTVTPGSLARGHAVLYRITPTHDGATAFTVNGDHILVLTNNVKPRAKAKSNHRGWRVLEWKVNPITNRMYESSFSRGLRNEAQARAHLATVMARWRPPEWEVSVRDFRNSMDEAQRICKLIACKAITFNNPQLPSLQQRLTALLNRPPTLAQVEYMAWWLGMWVSDGHSGRASVYQGGAPPPDPHQHQQIFNRLLTYQQLFNQPVLRAGGQLSTAGWPVYWFNYGVGSVADRVLRSYGLINNKHISQALICDSIDVRRRCLAGLIDGDGYYSERDNTYEIHAKHRAVIDGYKELAATLGLRNGPVAAHACTDQQTGVQYNGYRIIISGRMWDAVQYCAATYKQCPQPGTAGYVQKNKDTHCYGFTITRLPVGPYFGFTVHGGVNQRFLLKDYTVTHNTASLLCSVLAWARQYTERLVREAAVLAAGNPAIDAAQLRFPSLPSVNSQHPLAALGQPPQPQAVRPRVIYSSRTHSQLSKVVSELKRTAYTPRVTLLGSRQQLCVHEDVKGLTGLQQNHACHALVNRHECVYYETLAVEMQRNTLFSASPTGGAHSAALSAAACMDIEDLVQYGTDHKLCPYFLTREALPHSELVLLPYNYLIEPTIRDKLNLSLQNAVVIFDEAHNLDAVCTEAASIDLSVIEIGQAVAEVQRVLEEVQSIQAESEQQRNADPWASKHAMSAAMGGKVPELHSVAILKVLLLEMERVIDSHELRDEEKGETRDGAYMYELLNQCKIGTNSHSVMLQLVEECVDFLLRMEEGALSRGSRRRGTSALSKVAQVLRVLFAGGEERWREAAKDYRVHLHMKHAKKRVWNGAGGKRGGPFNRQSTNTADDNDTDTPATSSYRVLSYWCFNPGLSMKSLSQCGVRSFLFTSGTLSPLDSFAAEFNLPFPIRLENEHIISASQLLLVTLTHGPASQPLLSSYTNRSNREYMLDLGNAIVNFVRMVPDGVLVFFPSYGVMDAMVGCWETGGIMARIREKKVVVMEPRVSGEMSECIAEYQRAIEGSAAAGLTGALMLAVCRGKVSEGLDFADANGRAVIITGLPYPALHEPKVRIKREYLDQRHAASAAASPLTGSVWYQQQASRAVNQAIGRVIRHVNDYGAILLCDKRFAQTDQRMQLSSWIRGRMEVHERFGGVIGQVRGFFKRMEGDTTGRGGAGRSAAVSGGSEAGRRLGVVEKRVMGVDERKEVRDESDGVGLNRKRQAVDVGFVSLLDDSYSALQDGISSTPSSTSSSSSLTPSSPSLSSAVSSSTSAASSPPLSSSSASTPTTAYSFRAVVDTSSATVRPSLPTPAGHRSLFNALQTSNPVRSQGRPA